MSFEHDPIEYPDTQEHQIPNAAVIKYRDGNLRLIKFVVTEERVSAFEADIDSTNLNEMGGLDEVTCHNIMFAYINYEFDLDGTCGVIELRLSRLMELASETGIDGTESVPYVEDLISSDLADFVNLYIDFIEQMR